ncbi:MAG: hypothetical protein FWC50_13375 [Planctomycetaceae bacterium]|nr:hypothetical protein [Planctomycetaceae bacterium]
MMTSRIKQLVFLMPLIVVFFVASLNCPAQQNGFVSEQASPAGSFRESQQPMPSQEPKHEMQRVKIGNISADSAKQLLLQSLSLETTENITVVADPVKNELTLIGTTSAVQAALQTLPWIDRPIDRPNRQSQMPSSSQLPQPSQYYINQPVNEPYRPSQQPQPQNPLSQNPTTQSPASVPGPFDSQRNIDQNHINQNNGPGVAPEANEPGTYFCKKTHVAQIATELRRRYGNDPTLEIDVRPETGKILAWAPERVQREISALLAQTGAFENVPPGRDLREFEGTLVRIVSEPQTVESAETAPVQQSHSPKYLTLENIELKLQTLFVKRMIPVSQGGETRKFRVVVPGAEGTSVCEVTFDMNNYRIDVKAPPLLADELMQLIRAVDQPSPTEGYDRRFISVQHTDPEKVRKVLDTYRSKVQPQSNNSGQLNRQKKTPLNDSAIRQVAYNRQNEDGLGGMVGGDMGGMGMGFDAGGMPLNPENGGQQLNLTPSLNTKIQVLPRLDVVIIDAPQSEVQRIMEMIKQLEEISEQASPQIEIMFLKNVQCQSVEGLLKTQVGMSEPRMPGMMPTPVYLYTELLATKQGRVWAIPLVNPNAMLLVGWGKALEAMKALIDQLDKPVAVENSLLRVIRLEYAPAREIAQVITDFFLGNVPPQTPPGIQSPSPTLGFPRRVRIMSDPRSNSLIVQAAPNDYRDIERIVTELDVWKGGPKLQVKTYRMKSVLATDLATSLNTALALSLTPNATTGRTPILEIITDTPQGKKAIESGFLTETKFTANAPNNTLIVTAPSNSMALIDELITMLDVPSGTAVVKVIPIEYSDAQTIKTVLETLIPTQGAGSGSVQLPGTEGDENFIPTKITNDPRSNSLIVAGAEQAVAFIQTLIKRLDQKDALQWEVQVYTLKNSSANDVSRAVKSYIAGRSALQTQGLSAYQRLENAAVVVPDPISNKLLITATPEYMQEILKMIKELDKEPPQVVIQVLIGEVTLSNTDEFGIELGLQDPVLFSRSVLSTTSPSDNSTSAPGFLFNEQSNNASIGNGASTNALTSAGTIGAQALSSFATGRINSDTGFGGLILSASSDALSIMIRAMQEHSRLEVLSRPQITAQDNQLAVIFVGQTVARPAGSNTSTFGVSNDTKDQDVGLFLGVIPRISQSENGDGKDKVVMLISASKSGIGSSSDGVPTVVNGTVVRTPNINKIRTETIVSATDGETVLLGGLISRDKQTLCRRVPYLSNVPVLGSLFRYDYERIKRSELIFIMRPRIVRRTEDMDEIKRLEAARMSWCLADVTRLNGDIGVYNTTSRNAVIGNAPVMHPDYMPPEQLQQLPQPQLPQPQRVNSGNDPMPVPTISKPMPTIPNMSPPTTSPNPVDLKPAIPSQMP